MVFNTNLPVPIFNVLKYFIISVFLEAAVRFSLDMFESFFRAVALCQGRPVCLSHSRIDRYNLSSRRQFRKNTPAMVTTTALACCAYSVEILLEFSSGAEIAEYSRPGGLNLYAASHQACTVSQLLQGNTMPLIMDLATSCVDIIKSNFVFYNVSWVKQNDTMPAPLCVHAKDNILQEGPVIYKNLDYANDSLEEKSISSFRRSLHANSWESSGDPEREVVVVQQNQDDIHSVSRYSHGGDSFIRAVLLTKVQNTSIQCVGTATGKYGEGVMSSFLFGCFVRIEHGYIYIQTPGTALIEEDAEYLEKKNWSSFVVLSTLTHKSDIYNFSSEIIDEMDIERLLAYSTLLALASGKDADSLNRYAVVYKYCSEYFVPKDIDSFQEQKFDKATAEPRITAFIYNWGIIVAIVWILFLITADCIIFVLRKRKNLPGALLGENDIGRRWLSRYPVDKNGRGTQLDNDSGNSKQTKRVNCRWCLDFTKEVFLVVEKEDGINTIVVKSTAEVVG